MWAFLLAPAEGFGPSGKKELFMLFWLTLGHFWCSVETSVTFSSNLINFEKNPKNPKKIQKNPKKIKNSKNLKNPKKSKKSEKIAKKSQKTQKIHKKPKKIGKC